MDRCSICHKCTCFHAYKLAKYNICSGHVGGRWLHHAGEVKWYNNRLALYCYSWIENGVSEEVDVDDLLVSLKHKIDSDSTLPTCVASDEVKLHAKGIGTVCGRLLLGTAEKIPPSELVDTTGAGDSFIGAIIYALCVNMPPEKMLPFASQVAGIGCRALGARTGLPRRSDPRLTFFLL